VVGGGSFAFFQYLFGAFHLFVPGMVVFHITDVAASILSMLALAAFLKLWQPKNPWHFDKPPVAPPDTVPVAAAPDAPPHPHGAEAEAFKLDVHEEAHPPLTFGKIVKAWTPYAIMSICLMLTGFLRQQENKGDVWVIPGVVKTRYLIDIPTLHEEVERAARLQKPGLKEPEKEKAQFNFTWASAAGTPCFVAAILSALFLRMSRQQMVNVMRRTFFQMKVPIPTIACMLGLSYVTRYAGMDATLGIAFAGTGLLYPFFAAILGWLGVFLTGTDAGSNALFGSLQKITATEVWNDHHAGAMSQLSLEQAQTLICTANSTGGVMGKMIDAQSICVATAGTNQIGREADIFKSVVWHSIFLAAIVGLMTLVQAYVFPFTGMVPGK
jgi:lactate permease